MRRHLAAVSLALAACTPQQVKTVLEAEKIACILGTSLTDVDAVEKFCATSEAVRPIVADLVATKNDAAAARRAGLHHDR